jgi:hypothetical protein
MYSNMVLEHESNCKLCCIQLLFYIILKQYVLCSTSIQIYLVQTIKSNFGSGTGQIRIFMVGLVRIRTFLVDSFLVGSVRIRTFFTGISNFRETFSLNGISTTVKAHGPPMFLPPYCRLNVFNVFA